VTADFRSTAAYSTARPPILARIATWSFTHRRRAVGAWLLLLIVVTGIGRAAGSAYRDDFSGGNPQSQQAQTLLAKKFPADAGDRAQIVFQARRLLRDTAAPRIEALLTAVRRLPDVTGVTDPLSPTGGAQLSRDGRTGYAVVQFDHTSDRLRSNGPSDLIRAVQAADSNNLHVVVGGAPIEKVQKPKFGKAESIGLLAALIILMVAFGSLVAAGLPVVTALFGLAISFGILDLVSHGQTCSSSPATANASPMETAASTPSPRPSQPPAKPSCTPGAPWSYRYSGCSSSGCRISLAPPSVPSSPSCSSCQPPSPCSPLYSASSGRASTGCHFIASTARRTSTAASRGDGAG
jgi:hypothetical protein